MKIKNIFFSFFKKQESQVPEGVQLGGDRGEFTHAVKKRHDDFRRLLRIRLLRQKKKKIKKKTLVGMETCFGMDCFVNVKTSPTSIDFERNELGKGIGVTKKREGKEWFPLPGHRGVATTNSHKQAFFFLNVISDYLEGAARLLHSALQCQRHGT